MVLARPRRALVAALLLAKPALAAPQHAAPRPEEYGFSGLINSRLNDGVFRLTAADVDSDGLTDLVLINNAKSRIDFLLQRKPGEALPPDKALAASSSVNALADEGFFRRDSFPIEQKVSAIAIADWNGDGRNDLAFVGDSGKLTVAWRGAKEGWPERARFDVDELSNVPQALRAADVDGDGRVDLLVLGKRKTQLFLQSADGKLVEGTDLLNATASPDGFSVADVDGDRRPDLLYVKADSDAPFRFRLARGKGEFGPERLFPFAEVRSYTLADGDGDGRVEIGAVRRRSGRVALLRFAGDAVAAQKGELLLSAPRVIAYATQKDEKPRDELLADLDGDGRPELLVAEPSAARVVVHRGDPDGLACRGDAFSSLVGARNPRLGDLDGDGKPELVVAAPEEGAIGVAKLDGGKPGFPAPLGFKGEQLLAIDVADVDGSGKAGLFALVASGKGTAKSYSLARLAGGEPLSVALKKIPTDPTDLWLVDLNRDGLRDALVFVPTEVPRVLLAQKDAAGALSFAQVETQDVPGLGVLKGAAKASLFHGDVDGDGKSELLVPGPNFARAFTLGAGGVPEIVAQWNLDDGAAKAGAVAAGDLDGDGKPEVIVHERTTKSLRVLRQADGAAAPVARVELGDLEPKSIRVADLDGDGRQELVLLCADRAAVVQAGRRDPGFVEALDFECPVPGAYLDELAFGDVNGDGVTDCVLTEQHRHLVAIAALVEGKLQHVLQFPIFEESIFERDSGGGKEPRELVLGDFNGDRKLDVAILVHDRVLVYPQE